MNELSLHSPGERGRTALHDAADSGDLVFARALLDCGANADAEEAHGFTPLAWAKTAEMAKLLLNRGASLGNDRSALQEMIETSDWSEEAFAAVPVLLRAGADATRIHRSVLGDIRGWIESAPTDAEARAARKLAACLVAYGAPLFPEGAEIPREILRWASAAAVTRVKDADPASFARGVRRKLLRRRGPANPHKGLAAASALRSPSDPPGKRLAVAAMVAGLCRRAEADAAAKTIATLLRRAPPISRKPEVRPPATPRHAVRPCIG